MIFEENFDVFLSQAKEVFKTNSHSPQLQRATAPTGKAYDVAQIRREFPKAYEPWDSEEENLLKNQWQRGIWIKDIARRLGRKPGAIRSRLKKMGILP